LHRRQPALFDTPVQAALIRRPSSADQSIPPRCAPSMTQAKALIIPVTPFQQNCTLLWCEATKRAVVIDPGGDLSDIERAIAQADVARQDLADPWPCRSRRRRRSLEGASQGADRGTPQGRSVSPGARRRERPQLRHAGRRQRDAGPMAGRPRPSRGGGADIRCPALSGAFAGKRLRSSADTGRRRPSAANERPTPFFKSWPRLPADALMALRRLAGHNARR
jgi:hypothetical protein